MAELKIEINLTFVSEGEYHYKLLIPIYQEPVTKKEQLALPIHNAPSDSAGPKTISLPNISAGVF